MERLAGDAAGLRARLREQLQEHLDICGIVRPDWCSHVGTWINIIEERQEDAHIQEVQRAVGVEIRVAANEARCGRHGIDERVLDVLDQCIAL
jgi:hypothetical protein